MTWLQCALWGVFGGFAVEGLEFTAAIRRGRGWPWRRFDEPGFGPFLVSVMIRLGIGGGLAAAIGAGGQLGGPLGAVAVGIAAPLIIEKLARQALLSISDRKETSGGEEPIKVSVERTVEVNDAG